MAPTIIEEPGSAKPAETKRAELATPREIRLSDAEVAEIRALGDNTGSMALKDASPQHEGAATPDRWALDDALTALADRRGIYPVRELARSDPR